MIAWEGARLLVTPLGRTLVRSVCAVFDVHLAPVLPQVEAGEEYFLAEGRHHDPADRDAELSKGGRHQVMGDGPLGRHALDAHGDGIGFELADPDGQVTVVHLLFQDHDVLRGRQMNPNAVDSDLDQIVRSKCLLGS